MTPICKDCVFVKELDGRFPTCGHPHNGLEPVRGTIVRKPCALLREAKGKCGPEGRLYIPVLDQGLILSEISSTAIDTPSIAVLRRAAASPPAVCRSETTEVSRSTAFESVTAEKSAAEAASIPDTSAGFFAAYPSPNISSMFRTAARKYMAAVLPASSTKSLIETVIGAPPVNSPANVTAPAMPTSTGAAACRIARFNAGRHAGCTPAMAFRRTYLEGPDPHLLEALYRRLGYPFWYWPAVMLAILFASLIATGGTVTP